LIGEEAFADSVGDQAKEPAAERTGDRGNHDRADHVLVPVRRHAEVAESEDKGEGRGGYQHQRGFLLRVQQFPNIRADQQQHAQQPEGLCWIGVAVEGDV